MNVRQAETKLVVAGSYIKKALEEMAPLSAQLNDEVMTVDPSSDYGRAFDVLALKVTRIQSELASMLTSMPEDDDVFARLLESQPAEAQESTIGQPLMASGV